MSAQPLSPWRPTEGGQSIALGRSANGETMLLGVAATLAAVGALVISLSVAEPSLLLTLALALGTLAVVALMVIPRLEVTVTALALYLGLCDGPVKLLSGSQGASSVRDVLIASVSLGALARLLAARRSISLPALSGWVLAFVLLVLTEALNPNTHGLLKILGGFRQQLEWVPFFFFGYALMRSKERLRKLFVILGVIALANGAVSAYQTTLTPAQLAKWGPGYAAHVNGTETLAARRYKSSNGETLVRPPALGSDSGFGGEVGVLALPGVIALIATARRRRRWLGLPLFLGAGLAVATGQGRLQVVGSVLALVIFGLLSLSAGRHAKRPLAVLLALLVCTLPFGVLLVTSEGSGVFSRYSSITPSHVLTTSTSYKEKSLSLIPHYISKAPFGFGLATAGPAANFGGSAKEELEGHGVTAETQYNYVVDELGLIGLVLFVGILLQMLVLALTRLPRVADVDTRICLAAVFAPVFAYAIMGLRGAFTDTAAAGPYFWLVLGTAAYWLARGAEAARGAGVARGATLAGRSWRSATS